MSYSEKDSLIRIIHNHSNSTGDKLIEFMNMYELDCLEDATVEQLREYVDMRGYGDGRRKAI